MGLLGPRAQRDTGLVQPRYRPLLACSHDGFSGECALMSPARGVISNRFYIAAMFAIIAVIGSCGILAILRSQESATLVAQSFENANAASEMRTALDRENAELLSEMRQRQGLESDRLVRATEMFDAANLAV